MILAHSAPSPDIADLVRSATVRTLIGSVSILQAMRVDCWASGLDDDHPIPLGVEDGLRQVRAELGRREFEGAAS